MSKQENKKVRQPIVTVMGHVDHGKTTFLDSVRGTRVAEKEHGGITQNTRVHEVTTKTGFKITFIDTPGHEAFSKMRERGARVTDFVMLIVAADDGVQPQTKESIEFANKHNVPIIVGINKIDIEGADIKKIKTQLSSFGVQIEEFGGESMCFEISAKNKIGLDAVLEGIELLAEVKELKPTEPKEGVLAEAFVLESNLNKNLGHAAVCILKSGHVADRLICFTQDMEFSPRAYLDETGKPLKEIHQSKPFTLIGLSDDLQTGDIVNFANNKNVVKEIQSKLKSGEISEDVELPSDSELNAEDLFAKLLVDRAEQQAGIQQKHLNVILRASSQGTLEAIIGQLNDLETQESKVNVLSSGTGFVTEDDINRAKVAKAIVLTFQSQTPNIMLNVARREKVLVRDYEIIYDMIDEIADVLDTMDLPKEQEVEIARLKIKGVFTLSDGSQIAGGDVTNGTLKKSHPVWIERGGEQLGKSKIRMLKQGKTEIKEAKKGLECGIMLEPKFEDLREGDEIVAYKVERL